MNLPLALRIRHVRRHFGANMVLLLFMVISSSLSASKFTMNLRSCPDKPNCVCSLAENKRHGIAPLQFSGASDKAWEKLKMILASQKNIRIVEASGDYLRVEARSRLFRFVDDMEFVLVPDERLIQFRSGAQRGYTDFGVNRRRMESIRRQFQK